MAKERDNIPVRRFPQFVKENGWNYVNANELFEPIVNKNHNSDLPVLAITQDQGAVPREKIGYNVIVSEKSIAGYKVVEVGDFIISLRSFQGGIEYSYYKGLCSPAYIVLRRKNDTICNDFYRHYFKSWQFIQNLNRNLEGIRDGKMVSYQQFSEILIPYPPFVEQQKIADCLSSIDELIKRCNGKLEMLKSQKEGLMQQLLAPINGGGNSCVTPTLRFPKFKNTKGWEIKKLKDIAFRITVKNKSKKDLPVFTNSASGGIVNQQDYFDREIVTKDNLVNYSIVEVDDFVYNPRISTTAPVGPISRNRIGRGVMSPLYTIFRFSDGDIDFFEHYFKTNCWHQYMKNKANFGARFDRMNITNEDFMNMPIPFPPIIEQKQIAESFSSIDEVIEIYSERVAISKQHKIGLMQQLFPKQVN